jgi:membrane protease YdiL (CAAX protease family)
VRNSNSFPPGKFRHFWGGYVFLFDKGVPATYPADTGIHLLVIVVLLEGLIRPALRSAIYGGGHTHLAWRGLALVATMLFLAIGLTHYWLRIPLSCLGLFSWRRWGQTEKWFFPQVMMIGLVVHASMQWTNLCRLPHQPAWIGATLVVLVQQVSWGFYQEFVYRGLLQTELVRRWGHALGILVSNLLFTFGPLHMYHLGVGLNDPAHLLIFLAIFAIGLYFGILYHTSQNLWMIGLLHGLGDFFIDGLPILMGASVRSGFL